MLTSVPQCCRNFIVRIDCMLLLLSMLLLISLAWNSVQMCYCQPDDADWVTGKNIIAHSLGIWYAPPSAVSWHMKQVLTSSWDGWPFWPQYTWAKKRGTAKPLSGGGSWDSTWAEVYLHTKWHLHPSSRLATTDMGWKLEGGCAPFGRVGLDYNPTQCCLDRGLPNQLGNVPVWRPVF